MSGQTFPAGVPPTGAQLTAIVYQNDQGISNANVTAGTDTTTSATYVNMAGTGAVTSFSFTKALTGTNVKVNIDLGWTAATNSVILRVGALVNGFDYDCSQAILATGGIGQISGFAYITGLAAGTYTVQARWKRQGGTGTATRDTNGWLAISAAECT